MMQRLGLLLLLIGNLWLVAESMSLPILVVTVGVVALLAADLRPRSEP